MAIASLDSCSTDNCKDTVGITKPDCYKTEICNSAKDDLSALAFETGKTWKVDYFPQVLGEDDPLYHLDSHTSPVYQNYTRIKDLIIIVDQAVSTDIDSDTNEVTITGSGRIPGIIRANVGDVLLGSINGSKYILKVLTSVASSINKDAWMLISYQVTSKVSDDPTEYNTLIDKVVDTQVFDASYGLINETDATQRSDLTPFINSAMTNYVNKVGNDRDNYIGLLKDGKLVYDPEMTQFVSNLISGSCGVSVPDSIPLNKTGKALSLLDVMMNRSLGLTSIICPTRCLYPVTNINDTGTSGILLRATKGFIVGNDYHVFEDASVTINPCGDPFPVTPPSGTTPCMDPDEACCGCNTDNLLNDVNSDYGRELDTDNGLVRLIKSPFDDDYYILSESFYTGDIANMTYLESLVHKYIKNEEVTVSDVLPLWRDTINWCSWSWFYYMPLLLLLSKFALAKRSPCVI